MKDGRKKEIADRILRGLNEFADALEKNESITEKFTRRKIKLDLIPIPYPPEAVKATRQLMRASQGLFAQFLGVKAGTVSKWERGEQEPNAMACRFLDEIQRNPEYWRKRLRDSIQVKVG